MINSKETGVYKITNLINNKFYIGSSTSIKDGFKDRIRTHIRLLDRNQHYNKHLQSSWNKYGGKNFIFEIIEIVYGKEKIIEREQYYIDTLNCCNPKIGYNNAKIANSQLGYKHTEESKKKMSETWNKNREKHIERLKTLNIGRIQSFESKEKKSKALIGYKHTEEAKQNMSIAQKGKIITEDTKLKISNTKKGEISKKRLKVEQLNLNGELIKIWNYAGEAEIELNIAKGKISAVCLGDRKTTGGFKWKYVENEKMV